MDTIVSRVIKIVEVAKRLLPLHVLYSRHLVKNIGTKIMVLEQSNLSEAAAMLRIMMSKQTGGTEQAMISLVISHRYLHVRGSIYLI